MKTMLLTALALLLCAERAWAVNQTEIITIVADSLGNDFHDCFMDTSDVTPSFKDTNFGAEDALQVGTQGVTGPQYASAWYRTWIYWDLSRSLPRWSGWDRDWCAVDSVKLALWLFHAPNGEEPGEAVDTLAASPVQKVTPIEGSGVDISPSTGLTWNDPDGDGAAAAWFLPGADSVDTTYRTRFGQQPWTRSEIPFSQALQDRGFLTSLTPFNAPDIGWFYIDVTDFQLAVMAGKLTNRGLVLYDLHPGIHGDPFGASPTQGSLGDPGPDQGHLGFWSRESDDPALRWRIIFYVRRMQPPGVLGSLQAMVKARW